MTINLSQNAIVEATSTSTVAGTNSYGLFAQNFNNQQGNITVNMAAGDSITSGGSGVNAYDAATSLSSGTILVNTEGTIHSGAKNNGSGTVPAGILAGFLGNTTGLPGAFNPNVTGNVIINNAADITAAAGDGIRGYNYGAGNITIDDTAGTIVALYATNAVNGYGDGISAQDLGDGNIDVTTAAGVVIHAGGSGIAANNADASVSGSLISVTAYGTIESE